MFVARPDIAPCGRNQIYARPDDISDIGKSWRAVLGEYNAAPNENPLGLLPAWRLYSHPAYKMLANQCGLDRLYVLSAGWVLLRADFLTPNYDITFSKAANVERYKRRGLRETYKDFCLPSDVTEPIMFFGGRDYVPWFCELTAKAEGQRTVFYAGSEIVAPGCALRRFGKPFTNWHYQCAKAFVNEEW